MRAVIQRVTWARVKVGERVLGEIGQGLMILRGVAQGDDEAVAHTLAQKIVGL